MMVAITGATGFLGRHLVREARSRGLGVRALVSGSGPGEEALKRQGAGLVRGRLSDSNCAAKLLEGAQVLVHLAALGVQSRDRDWERTVRVNTVEPLAWVELAAKLKVRRVVVAGTCLEYRGKGSLPDEPCAERDRVPLDEESALDARDAYGATKAAGGILLRALARERGLPVWYLRLASLYGPGDDPAKLLPGAIVAARSRAAFEMTNGEQIREWLHAADAVEAILSALSRDPPRNSGAINIGTGEAVETRELIGRVFRWFDAPRELVRLGARPYRGGETHYLVMSADSARTALGFGARRRLEDFLGDVAHAEADQGAST